MRRGMTIVELLVAGSLLLLLLTLVLALLFPTWRTSARTALRVDLQQRAALAMDQLVVDLERAAPASLSVHMPVLAVQRLEGYSGTGVQQWEQAFVVYHWSGDRLIKETCGPADLTFTLPDAMPTRLSPDELKRLAAEANGTERVLADAVVGFEATAQPLEVRLALRRQRESFELRRTLVARNDW